MIFQNSPTHCLTYTLIHDIVCEKSSSYSCIRFIFRKISKLSNLHMHLHLKMASRQTKKLLNKSRVVQLDVWFSFVFDVWVSFCIWRVALILHLTYGFHFVLDVLLSFCIGSTGHLPYTLDSCRMGSTGYSGASCRTRSGLHGVSRIEL